MRGVCGRALKLPSVGEGCAVNEPLITGCQPDSRDSTVRDERGACGNVGYGRGYTGTYRGNAETAKPKPKVARVAYLPDIGWPGFLKIAKSPAGARFIAPSAAQVERILRKHPHLRTMSIPAGTYKGQASPIASVGLWSLILVRPTLSEEIVYRLASAIHNGESALAERLQQGRYTTAQNTAIQVPAALLHRGVMRYFREAGVTGRALRLIAPAAQE